MITPLIKGVNKSTFITFPSALEDFNIAGQANAGRRVFFSHFALLNLPDITNSVDNKNVLDFTRIETVFADGVNSEIGQNGDRLDLSESLQNYLLNYESILSEQDWYNKDNLQTCSERIFFKWLKEVGGIRYRKSSSTESLIPEQRYKEENDNSTSNADLYNRVVQYISRIGIQGKAVGKKNSFKEVYVYVPSEVGATKNVLFKTVQDENYFPQMVVTKPIDSEYINGFDENSDNPLTGLDLLAHYDRDVNGISYTSYNNNVEVDNWWSYYGGLDAYLTDQNFNDSSNDRIIKTLGVETKEYLRPRLDGVQIDFELANYKESENTSIKTLEDLNRQLSTKSFTYNAILLYYTVTDESTGSSATNLYGIAFVGDISEYSAGSSRIESKNKFKSDNLLGVVGNGIGFRFNFKLDARQQSITPEIEIDHNEQNTFAMQQFAETMVRMGEILKRYENSIFYNEGLIEINDNLRRHIEEFELSKIQDDLSSLKSLIQENNINDVNNEIITNLSKKMDEILSGVTDIKVNLLATLEGKGGIDFTYNEETKVLQVSNKVSDYGDLEVLELSSINNNANKFSIKELKKLVVYTGNNNLTEIINLYIDDSTSWKKGQSVEIDFAGSFVGQSTVNIFTDSSGKVNGTPYSKKIHFGAVKKDSNFRIICLNPSNYEFLIKES